MDGWIDGWMDGWTDEAVGRSIVRLLFSRTDLEIFFFPPPPPPQHTHLHTQLLDVATAGAVALLRGGSGAFVQGYKVEFVSEDESE
jgi:hypothetical protein